MPRIIHLPLKFQHNYDDYTFRGKHKDEVIVLLLRKHWLILVFNFVPMLIFLAGILAIHFFAPYFFGFNNIDFNESLLYFFESFLIMGLWIMIFVAWINYYLDAWIVTNERIVNIEQNGLFRRQISELEFEKIQDITSEVNGIISTLFNFGFVYIQTAGEKERFVFKNVPNPVRVRAVIMQLQEISEKEEKDLEAERLRGAIR